MDRYQKLDVNLVPRYEVDFGRLDSAQSEDEFLRVSFELLKEAAPLVILVANTLDTAHMEGFTRNEGIVIGHLIRMSKLMRTVIAGIADDHGGDQQMQLTRQFLDSASTLAYLLEDPSDLSRFDSYVYDSLIAEREFLKDIEQQVAALAATSSTSSCESKHPCGTRLNLLVLRGKSYLPELRTVGPAHRSG